MKTPRPVSVLLVATVSAALQGGLAVLFVPVLSVLFAASGAAAPNSPALEYGMTIAVIAPLLCAVSGFLLGAFMALVFNTFVASKTQPRVVVEPVKVRNVSVGTAA